MFRLKSPVLLPTTLKGVLSEFPKDSVRVSNHLHLLPRQSVIFYNNNVAKQESLVIQGNFAPRMGVRTLRVIARLMALVLAVLILGGVIVYGLSVNLETSLKRLGQKTTAMSDENKELQVQLNRIQSFQNVANVAKNAPKLHQPEEIIRVNVSHAPHFPEYRPYHGNYVRVYGY